MPWQQGLLFATRNNWSAACSIRTAAAQSTDSAPSSQRPSATYAYPRYFFSNLSADIRQIFCDHCELLGIRWTQSNPRNISISHRESVALLDTFVGPKG